MSYFAELRSAWRPLLAATLGLATGMSIAGPVLTTIAPTMMRENAWDPAEFAKVGSLGIVSALVFPFIGRLADLIGVRLTALISMIALPLVYFAYSMMDGSLHGYTMIFIVQNLLCVTTTATVYTRLVVQHVQHARGLALAIATSGFAVSGAIIAPLLNSYVEANGWRASYQAMAIFAALAAVVVFLLIPPEPKRDAAAPKPKRSARKDYPAIFRARAFWLLLGAMILCNLPATIMLQWLKAIVEANGIKGADAGVMLAALPVGQLIGRFIAGVGLDRMKAHVVSFVTLAVPSIGLFLLASNFDAPAAITFSVFCIGFAFGAEGDILGFLVARHFGVQIFGSVMGLMTFALAASTASGAILLSITMAKTGGFDLYLVLSGVAVLVGSSLLLALGDGREPSVRDKEIEETLPHAAAPGALG